MIEAVIVFPIVLFTVFLLIYLGLFKLQEMAILHQVQRAARQGSFMAASPGYETLGDFQSKQIDFTASPEDVDAYYQAYHDSIPVLYREIFGSGAWLGRGDLDDLMENMEKDTMILAGISFTDQSLEVRRSLLSTRVEAQVRFGLPTPGALRYFGYDGQMEFLSGSVSTAISPSGFVRNVDLACDAIAVPLEKLGVNDDLDKIMEGIRKYLF